MDLGAPELLIILIIVGLLFGANKLPGLARGMGSAVSEFKKGQAEGAAPTKAVEAETATKPVETKAVETKAIQDSPETLPVTDATTDS